MLYSKEKERNLSLLFLVLIVTYVISFSFLNEFKDVAPELYSQETEYPLY